MNSLRSEPNVLLVGPDDGVLTIQLEGDWAHVDGHAGDRLQTILEKVKKCALLSVSSIRVDGSSLSRWDSRVLVAIKSIAELAARNSLEFDLWHMPEGIHALLRLSSAVPPRAEPRDTETRIQNLAIIGQAAINWCAAVHETNVFLGQSILSLWRFVRGKARFLRSDIAAFIQLAGPQALPIVGVINMLLGVILGFMGAMQLRQFGAQIYVADLVAVGHTREIAPMMTAIVMAGRTGAAYAAQLGTMQVNEEIDALRTFGFSPMDFLVLPRMLALALVFPLLVLYADALGIFGGYLVGVFVLDLNTAEYVEQTRLAIDMGDVALGVVKGSIFGVLVAVTGCMQGLQSGRSASAVGDATTSAVVSGIVAIIVTTAVFAVLTNVLAL